MDNTNTEELRGALRAALEWLKRYRQCGLAVGVHYSPDGPLGALIARAEAALAATEGGEQ